METIRNTNDLIFARQQSIQVEIAELSARVDELKAELGELDVAAKVMARLSEGAPVAPFAVKAQTFAPPTNSKPEGLPTTPDMILSVLSEAKRNGTSTLEPREIMEAIAKRWWPNVTSEMVGPIAWRMWKQGRLVKDGAKYGLCEPTIRDLIGPDTP